MLRTAFFFLLWAILLNGCGGGGGGTTPADKAGTDGSTGVTNELDLNGKLPYSASIGTGSVSMKISGLAPNGYYFLVLRDPTDDIALSTYLDSDHIVKSCASDEPATNTESCTTLTDGQGILYFKVDASGTVSGADFTIELLSPTDEGTKTAPLDISNQLPYKGIHRSESFYVVSGLNPGDIYTVTMSGVLFDSDLSTSMSKNFVPNCTSSTTGLADEQCEVTANFEGKIYINTDHTTSAAAATFLLDVSATGKTGIIFEGYRDQPIDITEALATGAHAGQVAEPYGSYYKVTGLTPGERYEVRMVEPSNPSTGYVYGSPDYYGSLCELSPSNDAIPTRKSCVATAPASGELYLAYGDGWNDAFYEVDIVVAPVAEGTSASPMNVSADSLPQIRQVDATDSYYLITGLVAGKNYTVDISQSSADTRLKVSSDPAVDGYGYYCTTSYDGTCARVVRANSNGEVYVNAGGADTKDQGAWFQLNIGDANNPEGSVDAPIDISTALARSTAHGGEVDNTASYYKFTGLNPGQRYMVHVADDTDLLTLRVFSDSAFSNQTCYTLLHDALRCLAPATSAGELFVQVNGYYSELSGTTYNIWAVPSRRSPEGTSGSPLDISTQLDANFQYRGQFSTYTPGYSYYMLTGLSGTYTVSLSEMTDDTKLEVFTSSGFATPVCTSDHEALREETCIVTTQSALYIRVGKGGVYVDSWDGAAFTLTVAPGGQVITPDGTMASPVEITGSPHAGEVQRNGNSYYKVTGLDPTSTYSVIVENETEDLIHNVYSDAFNTGVCGSGTYRDPFTKGCSGTPNANGELYIDVSGEFAESDARYDIVVRQGPFNEGDLASPLGLTQGMLPYRGEVAGNGTSYYRITGLTADKEYLLVFRNATADLDFDVYGTNAYDYGSYLCGDTGGHRVASCLATANGAGELYIKAAERFGTSIFTIELSDAPQQEATKAAPLALQQGVVHRGQKAYGDSDGTRSYYILTGLEPHSSHRISLSNLTGHQWVKLYADADYKYQLCYSGYDTNDVGCSAAANEYGQLYVEVGYLEAGYYDIFLP